MFGRRLLVMLAFVYPLYWAAEFLLHGAVPLLYAAFSGQDVGWFQVSYLHVGASVRGMSRWLAPAAALLAAILTLRIKAALFGLFVAALGHIGLQPLVWSLAERHTVPAIEMATYLLVLLAGAWVLTAAAPDAPRWRRAGFLLLIVPGSFLVLWLLFSLARSFPIPRRVYLSHIPAAIAIVLVSWRMRAAQNLPVRTAIVSAIVSIALWTAMPAMNAAIERSVESRRKAGLATVPATRIDAPYEKYFFQRGVNFTAEGRGGYATPEAQRMLRELRSHGVDAIALVPYGFVPRSRDHIRFPGGMERDDSIEELARLAHHLGMKVLLKPQLWVSGVSFPGELEYPDPKKFFAAYSKFLDHYARLATRTHADLFCVGVELAKLARFDSEWRRMIALARARYAGPLTYAATQGPEFESITFWDALDYIGLNNYYPLPDDLSTAQVLKKIEQVQSKYGKPVIFTEAGFASLEAPHRAPWDESPRKLSMGDQARAYEALLQGFYDKPWFYGVYWWKVGSDGFGGMEDASHTPWGKPAMDVIARWYRRPRAAVPPTP